MDLSKLIFNKKKKCKIYKWMERILYVLQYSYPKKFRSTNFKIINRKREENKTKEKKKKRVTFN